jgi:predicted branched-subunit amino acid permease
MLVTESFSLPTEKNKTSQIAIFGYMCFPQIKFWKIWLIATKVSRFYAILAHPEDVSF